MLSVTRHKGLDCVLASHNPGKLQAFQSRLANLLNLSSAADHALEPVDETASTFVENALLKARAVSQATRSAALSDDSGLIVPALAGAPGLYSARYAGLSATDLDNRQKLLQDMAQLEDRRAYYYCCLIFLAHGQDPRPIIVEASWTGQILREARGHGGFGYDSLFLPDGATLTAAEMSEEDKKLSHRSRAMDELLARLSS